MKYATVPVINGCDNTFHPSQALADMLTLYEKTGRFETKVLYIGAKNNTYNSLSENRRQIGRHHVRADAVQPGDQRAG